MRVADAGVFLQSRNPRDLDGGREDALAQPRDLFDMAEQRRCDGVERPKTHGPMSKA